MSWQEIELTTNDTKFHSNKTVKTSTPFSRYPLNKLQMFWTVEDLYYVINIYTIVNYLKI